MSEDDDVARATILAAFTEKWGEEEAERRLKLLEEAIPRVYDYAKLHNARAQRNVHPEHLEMYVAYLQPRVRAVIEHCGPQVIKSIENSMSPDERLAKIIRCVNIMDARAQVDKEKRRTD